jgi:hypothetical protein
MHYWTPSPPSNPLLSFFRKLIGLATLVGALAAGVQNFNALRDFAEKAWEQAQIMIFSSSALDRVYREYNAQSIALCASAKYTDLFKVSPCIVTAISDEHKNDRTQLTLQTATQLHDFSAERAALNNLLIGGYQKYGGIKERDYASVTASNEIDRLKIVRALIDKRINIGQYNSQLLSIYYADSKSLDALKLKHRDH